MTTDKELADACVALGVGKLFGGLHGQTGRYYTDSKLKQERTGYLMPELFVRDWRVAGALLEKCEGHLEALFALNALDYLSKDANLVREIIEACVLRLEAVSDTKG